MRLLCLLLVCVGGGRETAETPSAVSASKHLVSESQLSDAVDRSPPEAENADLDSASNEVTDSVPPESQSGGEAGVSDGQKDESGFVQKDPDVVQLVKVRKAEKLASARKSVDRKIPYPVDRAAAHRLLDTIESDGVTALNKEEVLELRQLTEEVVDYFLFEVALAVKAAPLLYEQNNGWNGSLHVAYGLDLWKDPAVVVSMFLRDGTESMSARILLQKIVDGDELSEREQEATKRFPLCRQLYIDSLKDPAAFEVRRTEIQSKFAEYRSVYNDVAVAEEKAAEQTKAAAHVERLKRFIKTNSSVWTDRSNRFKVEAMFLVYEDGKIALAKSPTDFVWVATSVLSSEDQRRVSRIVRDGGTDWGRNSDLGEELTNAARAMRKK